MSYTLEEAEKLKNHYSKELIGKYYNDEKGFKIDHLKIIKINQNENLYELQARTADTKIKPIVIFSEISKAAKKFGLVSPKEILNDIKG